VAREHVYRCAMCQKLKGECNHWYLLRQQGESYIQKAWNEEEADDDGMLNLCGRSCAHKAFEKWMEESEQ